MEDRATAEMDEAIGRGRVSFIDATALSKVGHVHFSGQKVAARQKQGQG